MSVLHPPIQEQVTIRKNIALGPAGLGQYFPVLSLPLGLGGVIRIHFPRYGAHMEDLVVNGLDVKPINYIAEKVDVAL